MAEEFIIAAYPLTTWGRAQELMARGWRTVTNRGWVLTTSLLDTRIRITCGYIQVYIQWPWTSVLNKLSYSVLKHIIDPQSSLTFWQALIVNQDQSSVSVLRPQGQLSNRLNWLASGYSRPSLAMHQHGGKPKRELTKTTYSYCFNVISTSAIKIFCKVTLGGGHTYLRTDLQGHHTGISFNIVQHTNWQDNYNRITVKLRIQPHQKDR